MDVVVKFGKANRWWVNEVQEETPDLPVEYIYYDESGITLWRKGVRNGYWVLDKALTLTGFNGIEDIDWENVRSVS